VPSNRLGDILVETGKVTAEQLERAARQQAGSGRLLGEVLRDLGLVTDDDIAEALAVQLQIPFFDLGEEFRLEKEEVRLHTTTMGYGYGPGFYRDPYWGRGLGMSSSTTQVDTFTKGTLVVDAWDARTKQLVWRGTVESVVPGDPKKAEPSLLTVEENEVLDKLARKAVDKGFTVPSILFLESVKPLNYIGSQALVFFEPIIQSIFNFRDYEKHYLGSFQHGGVSMEEMILPVITMEPK